MSTVHCTVWYVANACACLLILCAAAVGVVEEISGKIYGLVHVAEVSLSKL